MQVSDQEAARLLKPLYDKYMAKRQSVKWKKRHPITEGLAPRIPNYAGHYPIFTGTPDARTR